MTDLVKGIDVASYQRFTMGGLLDTMPDVAHVVVRMYLGKGWEGPSQQISIDEVNIAYDRGLTVAGYFWCYAAYDPKETLRRAIDLEQRCGIESPILWADFETYVDGSLPTKNWLLRLGDEATRLDRNVGIYTGSGFWKRIGNPDFSDWRLWLANYNGNADLEGLPNVGNMKLTGHQYGDHPCDLDVFDAEWV